MRNNKTRNSKIDILRSLAIVSIILAHSKPNSLLFQIRNFDVVLMVLLLGNSFYLSSHNKNFYYLDYVKKRFQRLVVPTWIFLSVFFFLFYFISVATGEAYYFNLSRIIHSYILTGGIGFVWIIKVFFIVALVSPFILKVSNKIQSNRRYYLLLAGGYLGYSFLLFINNKLGVVFNYLDDINHYLDGIVRTVYTEIVIYGIIYSLIAALGIRLARLSPKEITYACLLFFGIFLFSNYLNNHSELQNFKYPPQLYYISYGIFVSFLLYRLLDYTAVRKYLENKFILFISKTSDWLYFWHIIFVYVLILFPESLPSSITDTSSGRFLFILSATLLVTYVHQQVKAVINARHNKERLPQEARQNIETVFKMH